jgi:hypothetical protein
MNNHMHYMKRNLAERFKWDIAGPKVLDSILVTLQDGRVTYMLFKPLTDWNDDLMELMRIFTNTQPRREEDVKRPNRGRIGPL